MTIQRFPRGLQELLASKTQGINPDVLGAQLSTVLDLLQFYGLSDERYETVSGTVAEGAGVTLTVPDTQFWLLFDTSLHWVKTATATYMQGSIWQRKGTTGPFVGLATGPTAVGYPFASTAAATSLLATFAPSPPRLLTPGTVLYGTCDILGTDATADIVFRARVGVLE